MVTFRSLWNMDKQILLSWRGVIVGRLQALVLSVKMGHGVVYTDIPITGLPILPARRRWVLTVSLLASAVQQYRAKLMK